MREPILQSPHSTLAPQFNYSIDHPLIFLSYPSKGTYRKTLNAVISPSHSALDVRLVCRGVDAAVLEREHFGGDGFLLGPGEGGLEVEEDDVDDFGGGHGTGID